MKNGKMKKVKLQIILVLAVIIIAPLSWFLFNRLEGQKPVGVFEDASAFVGQTQELSASISDSKSGIRKLGYDCCK